VLQLQRLHVLQAEIFLGVVFALVLIFLLTWMTTALLR
jgi:hypothetical protein